MLEPKEYADWLHRETFQPAVVVISTEAAKASVRESHGLSLSELFGPFGGHYRKLAATCRCLERQTQVDDFRVCFVDADTASQWSASHAEQVAAWMVESSAKDAPKEQVQSLSPPSPWYEQWRLAIFRSLRWSEHECLDQPVAAMLVVSSIEPDPVGLLEQLLHSSFMPSLCTQGILDPCPARVALLLHNAADPAAPKPEQLAELFERVKLKFTPHTQAFLLQINRGSLGAPHEDLFRPFLAQQTSPPPPPGAGPASEAKVVPGYGLSSEDVEELSILGHEIVMKGAIPWIESRLLELEAQISQSRKGFSNQLKYLWRKPRKVGGGAVSSSAPVQRVEEQPRDHHQGTAYQLHTVEGQMRLAGDLAFFLRDYKTALGYYSSVVSDFKQDRSWKHVAGASEMWGVCCYVTGAKRSEWARCMESAYDHYLQAAAGRHAMRSVVLHQAMVCDYKDAAARLTKVSGDMSDTGLRSAMLLEQAGQLYYKAGSLRKGAFHVVLAGHTFNKLGFKRLALCSYQAVVDQYTSKQWFHITDHFHFTMARQAFGLGLIEESLGHFLKLLNSFAVADKRVSIQAEREATYVKEFLFVVRNWMEKRGITEGQRDVDLQIPCIAQQIAVLLPGDLQRELASLPAQPPPPPPAGQAAAVAEEPAPLDLPRSPAWDALGEKVLPVLSPEDRLELQLHRGPTDGAVSESLQRVVFSSLQRVVAVGSEVHVELQLSNPMKVKLELNNTRLGGALTEFATATETEDTEADSASAFADASTDAGTEADVNVDGGAAVDFRSESIILEPLETKRVRLVATPRKEGLLKIWKVSWDLFDQVHCDRQLKLKGRRLRDTMEQRTSAVGMYSTDRRLELKVRAVLPRVAAKLEGWPSPSSPALLLGELRTCTLVLTGSWGTGESVRIASSHPTFLALPESSALRVEQAGDVLVVHRADAGADELRIPLLLRADRTGCHRIRLCLLIEASAGSLPASVPRSERRQWLTLEEPLNVRPSLLCSVRQSPSYQKAARLMFTCLLENKAAEALEVARIRCASGDRELPLEDCAPTEGLEGGAAAAAGLSRRAEPGQLVQLLYALQRGLDDGAAVATTQNGARQRLLKASRTAAAAVAAATVSRKAALAAPAAAAAESVDLVAEWQAADGRVGEVYMLRVTCDRPSTSPCPLDMHLLAATEAVLSPELLVPVTLQVRNASTAGPVSFYFVVDAVPEFALLGCEHSEIIRLAPYALYEVTLHAAFTAPGVFNLNRFRLFVVTMPLGVGVVPASEQAPLAFAFPFERLIHVHRPG